MFKAMKKFVAIMLGALTLAFAACAGGVTNSSSSSDTSSTPTVTPTLSETAIELAVLESVTLTVNDFVGEVEWTVSDYRILKVENGVVTCVGVGVATVTAMAGETTLTCEVTGSIEYTPVPYVVFVGEAKDGGRYALNLLVGDSYEMEPVLFVAGEQVENVSFTLTTDSAALTVDGMTVTATAAVKEAVVSATCEYEGKSYLATFFVSVSEV